MTTGPRTIMVTGGGDGIGRAAALRMAAPGSLVVVTDLDERRAAAVAAEARRGGADAWGLGLDVRDVDAVDAAVGRVADEVGHLNVLFNNAGMPGPSGLEPTPEEFAATMEVNLRGGMQATSAAVELLAAGAPDASVVFTASVAGVVGSPLSPLYSASKGGVVTLAKSLALALAPRGIRVNAVCPGPTATAMLPRFVSRDDDATPEERRAMLVSSVPLGRTADPSEIAEAVAFLASPAASFITGAALPVDGGYLAR